MLKPHDLELEVRISSFDGAHETAHVSRKLTLDSSSEANPEFAGVRWDIQCQLEAVEDRPDAVDGRLRFTAGNGESEDVAVGMELRVTSWSENVFVMLPAAAYNGNRYPSRPYAYPPMIHEPEDIGPDSPVLISDVPRLNHETGEPSRMQLSTGDLTTPAICFFNPDSQRAMILLTEQGGELGNHGLTVKESDDRDEAILRIEAPCVRRDTLYTMVDTSTPSWDRGARWEEGSAETIRFRMFSFRASTRQDLFDRFVEVRRDLSGEVDLKHELPLSTAFDVVSSKYQRENWCEEGYYRVGTREAAKTSAVQDWQTGWTGGGIAMVPLLMAGDRVARRRAIENIEWMFSRAQLPSGFFYAVYSKGEHRGDGFVPGTDKWYMVRKQADALYFLVKAFSALEWQEEDWQTPEHWAEGTCRLADQFISTYDQYGQLGQYLHRDTGEVMVGGSTAAAMAPGALALAGDYFGRDGYVETAVALAAQLNESDVESGVTTGGPGEIMKCPDSESAFAMLESFITLFEVTSDGRWLRYAENMAAQCMTWCASYDYEFPPDSWLGSADIRGAGSVWANVQNKHSSPGICTLSGDSLFRLFRYTGRELYLKQIQEIAHNLPQYICRTDRQLGPPEDMKPGYICERVNFSDWEGRDNVGGSLFGSCWPEVSMLLTSVEIPGIYLQPDTGLLWVSDHLEVSVVDGSEHVDAVECYNPTDFDAEVSLLCETSSQAEKIMSKTDALDWPQYRIPSRETRVIDGLAEVSV